MKVYLVRQYDWVRCAFLDEEKAKAYLQDLQKQEPLLDCGIDEMETAD